MNRKDHKVLVTRQLPEPVETRMRELFDVKLSTSPTPMSKESMLEVIQNIDILVPTIGDRIDFDFIQACGENLKLIANYGAGYDHIDVNSARSKGIAVTNTPNVLTEDTAVIG